MRQYYDLIQTLKTTFESDTRVKTIVSDAQFDMDSYRKNIYPIVNITVIDSPQITESTALSSFNVEVTCLDIRDWNKEDVNDKFYYNDNRHDNWNLTHSILELAKDKLVKEILDNNITISGTTSLERISWGLENGLDGWVTNWTIEVPKDYNAVC